MLVHLFVQKKNCELQFHIHMTSHSAAHFDIDYAKLATWTIHFAGKHEL